MQYSRYLQDMYLYFYDDERDPSLWYKSTLAMANGV